MLNIRPIQSVITHISAGDGLVGKEQARIHHIVVCFISIQDEDRLGVIELCMPSRSGTNGNLLEDSCPIGQEPRLNP